MQHATAQLRRIPYLEIIRPLLIVCGVLFACTYIPYNLPSYVLLLIASIAPAIFVGLQLKNNMGLSILSVVPLCILVNYDLGTGTGTSVGLPLMVLCLLVGLWLFDMFVLERKFSFVASRSMKPLVIFAMATVVAFLIGQLGWFYLPSAPLAAQLGGVTIFILSFCAFFLVANQLEPVWLERMVWLYIILGGIYVFARSLELWTIVDTFFHWKARGSLFWAWLTAMCGGQLLFNRKLGWRVQVGLVVVLGCVLYLTVINNFDWKSGWIPMLAVLMVLVGFKWQGLIMRYFLIIIPIGALAMIYAIQQIVSTDQYSYLTRLDAWWIMWQLIKYNPFTGLGPANYYWYTPIYPIRGYAVQFNSHHQLLDIVAQTGFIGLFCYFWFFAALFRIGWRMRRQIADGFPQAYLYSVLAGIVGTLVASMLGDWVLPFVYNIGLEGLRTSLPAWMFMGGLVIYERILRDEQEDSTLPIAPKRENLMQSEANGW
ncbi:MAG: O-antigen ligase family protein [Chloroflexota bacterium]